MIPGYRKIRTSPEVPLDLATRLWKLQRARKIPCVWICGPEILIARDASNRFRDAIRLSRLQAYRMVCRAELGVLARTTAAVDRVNDALTELDRAQIARSA